MTPKDVSKEDRFSLPLPSRSDLRGRQSVRATFRLTERAINTLSIVASHLGIKQKSLFDHLIEDTHSLNTIAEKVRIEHFGNLNRIQKTYVISRKTMVCLCEAAEKYNTPRDALVEYSIQRLLPIIAEERDRHQNRKRIQTEMSKYLLLGEKLLQKTASQLGEEDPVYIRFAGAMAGCRNAYRDILDFVEKAEMIEDL